MEAEKIKAQIYDRIVLIDRMKAEISMLQQQLQQLDKQTAKQEEKQA